MLWWIYLPKIAPQIPDSCVPNASTVMVLPMENKWVSVCHYQWKAHSRISCEAVSFSVYQTYYQNILWYSYTKPWYDNVSAIKIWLMIIFAGCHKKKILTMWVILWQHSTTYIIPHEISTWICCVLSILLIRIIQGCLTFNVRGLSYLG